MTTFRADRRPSRLSPGRGRGVDKNESRWGMETTENVLVARAQSGSEDAFAELASKHSSQIYKCSLRILHNREDAEDNLQNVLVQAFRNINSFESKSQFSTWLVRVARNAADPGGSASAPDKGNSEAVAAAKERNTPLHNGRKEKYKHSKINKIPRTASAPWATFIPIEKENSAGHRVIKSR